LHRLIVMRPKKPSGLPPKLPEEWDHNASAEFNVHSFIVKVWLEEDANNDRGPTWHGHITHVPGGERRYLRKLGEIAAFVEPYLKAMGIRFGLRERIRRCLSLRNYK
jgi:hypothetical protein